MNYRHAYHAGNFADVLKHIVFVLCLEHLKKKDAPFRVIDTHAGPGTYALESAASAATGEWRDGIGKLFGPDAAPLPAKVATILAPYLEVIRRAQDGRPGLSVYPGSPAIAASLLRKGDKLVANELHPVDGKALAKTFAKDKSVQVMALDGYTALKALLPPPERRGLVLVDPPFEEPGELIRMTDGLSEALERFRTGTFALWYPIKDIKPVARFHRGVTEACAKAAIDSVLIIELHLRAIRNPDLLNGSGLVVVNPPYTLVDDFGVVLPELSRRLAAGPGAQVRLERLALPSTRRGERHN